MDDVGMWQLNGSGLVFWVRTRSGTTYEIDDAASGARLRRLPARFDPVADVVCASLRRDAEWIEVFGCAPIVIGRPMSFLLEPLGDPELTDFTARMTTAVVSVETRSPESPGIDAGDAQ